MTPIELTKTEFIQRVGNFEESPKDWKYVGDEEELEAAFKIRTIPTLLLCRMDGNKEMMLGTMGKPELRKVIEGIL